MYIVLKHMHNTYTVCVCVCVCARARAGRGAHDAMHLLVLRLPL